uniref:Retrovirus-related Pol polyprotein from transposon 17.6 n=1 Tax=Cajanus cajan TaxID=3821 RepID=A0A151UCX8_CAJCA|nr:Retrovirus-related Pol polyprotein from transposon 17.6 [Cajanus cajan]
MLPTKSKAPVSFTLPVTIGSLAIGKALLDLGASINLMPLSMLQRIGDLEVKPTRMTLQLANRSVKYPHGIVEDVLVKVDRLLPPADFVVMDIEEDIDVPLILSRPFMKTARVLIDVDDGKLKVRVNDEEVNFDVFDAMHYPKDKNSCFRVDVIDGLIEDTRKHVSFSTPLEKVLINVVEYLHEEEDREIEACLKSLDSYKEATPNSVHIEDLKEEGEVNIPKLELKILPSHLKYVFLEEGGSKLVIISSSLSTLGEEKLVRVLKFYQGAIGWSISDLKGISLTYCMHKIFMEDEYKPVAQPRRRLDPVMKEVVNKEVIKLLDVSMIYPISDSAWVSPVQVVPKKGGMTVIQNEKNELILSRTFTGWRMCIDYRKLNKATRKDHFPLPFMDQMLERLVGQAYYYFLDGEKSIEVFMDDFSMFRSSFDECLTNLKVVLRRCLETNLILNWEKCHFMVTKGIVLGHKISHRGIEVDPAKVEVIEKLPPPINVKGIRSLLGHAGFYRRFIKDFSMITRPLSNLLNKDSPFYFNDSCLKAFKALKARLTYAPIITTPDWKLDFELMCDASDYAVGAVLGQRRAKTFHVIHYASKVLNEA